MRITKVACGPIGDMSICQDEQYRMMLCRAGEREPLEQLRLYRVTIREQRESKTSFGIDAKVIFESEVIRYVLAENEYGAVSQASSGEEYNLNFEYAPICKVEKLPFHIRGWSSTEF